MAASTISNSGGPGSSAQLSPMTIKVRDKIIEQYADQSLDAINESLKRLLANEEDEQKRLGVLAARVYILRQRISGLSNHHRARGHSKECGRDGEQPRRQAGEATVHGRRSICKICGLRDRRKHVAVRKGKKRLEELRVMLGLTAKPDSFAAHGVI